MPAKKPQLPSMIWLVFLGLLVVSAWGLFSGANQEGGGSAQIPYSQFQKYLDAGKVKKVTVSGDVMHGTLTEKMPDGKTHFSTVQVPPDLSSPSWRSTTSSTAPPPATAPSPRCCPGSFRR